MKTPEDAIRVIKNKNMLNINCLFLQSGKIFEIGYA